MHSRKRSAAFLSDDTTTDGTFTNPRGTDTRFEQQDPSKRLLHNSGIPLSTSQPKLKYNAQRLLNNLAFTRLYVTANFQAWNPASSPVVLCCVDEQNELYIALCRVLPTLHTISPDLQALAMMAGYLNPDAMADQALLRLLPLTTTAGLEGTVAEDFEVFRRELGPADCIAVINASGECVWTSHEAANPQDLQQGLTQALKAGGGPDAGGDVAMPDG